MSTGLSRTESGVPVITPVVTLEHMIHFTGFPWNVLRESRPECDGTSTPGLSRAS